MGSTVTTNKLVAAFATPVGTIAYILFEETYEKNCHPHTPEMNCRFIGFLDEAIQYIFQRADACEGGMLQNRNGQITPEGYIDGWMEKLAEPRYMENRVIEIRNSGGYLSPLPDSQRDAVVQKLRQLGRPELADDVSTGTAIHLRLHEDFALLAALYDGGSLAPWRIIPARAAPTAGISVPGLGYAPERCTTVVLDEAKALRIDLNNYLMQQDDGSWRVVGWQYQVVGQYVASLGTKALLEPGAYRRKIKAYRQVLRDAPMMPAGGKVVVDWSKPLENDYERERVNRFPDEFPVVMNDTGYAADVVMDDNFLWHACALPSACTQWVFPATETPEAGQQLRLLAA